MTKCHILLLALTLAVLPSCKQKPSGPSLSELGSRNENVRYATFEQYILELGSMNLEQAFEAQRERLAKAENDTAAWQQLIDLEDKFLFDPNSPYRSEELYIPVAENIIASKNSTPEQREKAEWRLPRLILNRLGTKAADFSYLTRTGRPRTLYSTIDKANPKPRFTLLFFSNPGCPNCKEITEMLRDDLAMQDMIGRGEVLVVNIHPDQDLEAWLEYLPNYPSEWECGYDPDNVLNSDTIYWLRAIPSLYLLDSEKRVVLKDAPAPNVLEYCKER